MTPEILASWRTMSIDGTGSLALSHLRFFYSCVCLRASPSSLGRVGHLRCCDYSCVPLQKQDRVAIGSVVGGRSSSIGGIE